MQYYVRTILFLSHNITVAQSIFETMLNKGVSIMSNSSANGRHNSCAAGRLRRMIFQHFSPNPLVLRIGTHNSLRFFFKNALSFTRSVAPPISGAICVTWWIIKGVVNPRTDALLDIRTSGGQTALGDNLGIVGSHAPANYPLIKFATLKTNLRT